MKKICFWIKNLLFYIFVTIVFYSLTYLTIDIIFREPDVSNIKTYINGFTIIFYIILLLMITYIIFHIKNKKFNIVEIIIFSALIGIITLPSLYRSTVYKQEKLQEIIQGKEVINKDLTKYFEQKDYDIKFSGYNDGCHIICTDTPTYSYKINNNKLDLKYDITLNARTLEVESDMLIESFLEKQNINKPLTNYLRLLDAIPLSVNVNGNVKEIDFKNLNNDYSELNILSNSTFVFQDYSVNLDTLNKDEIINLSKQLFKVYKEYFYQDNIENDVIKFYVRKNDNNYGIGELKEKFDGVIFLDFRTYNDSDIELKFSDIIILNEN